MGEKNGRSIRSFLVVDDDETIRSMFQRALSRRGIVAHVAVDRTQALRLAREHEPDVALVDLQLGTDNGLDLLCDLRTEQPDMRVLIITGYSSTSSTVEAMRLGAVDVVPKPISVAEIMQRLDPLRLRADRRAIETPSAERALWEHVQRVLADCCGNKSEAARRLKKPRSWMYRFLARRAPKN